MKFIIFSPMHNNEAYAKRHMESVNNQTHEDFVHLIVNDASEDATHSVIMENTGVNSHVHGTLVNRKWIGNAIRYLRPFTQRDEEVVVVCLDGDDWFAGNDVLVHLNAIYEEEGCWLTYGQFTPNDKSWPGHRAEMFRNRRFRRHKWVFTHLKTFKGFLFNAIKKDDLRAPDGRYTPCTYDMAIMFPMLEMTPTEKIRFVEEVLCVYNIDNPNCVEKINQDEQIALDKWFRGKNPYEILKR